MWPAVTPLNVWDMEWQDWLVFAIGSDDWVAQQKKNAKG